MRTEFVDLCAALRSGFYEQGHGILCGPSRTGETLPNGDPKLKFCCAGVLEEVIGTPKRLVKHKYDDFKMYAYGEQQENHDQIDGVGNALNLCKETREHLSITSTGTFVVTKDTPHRQLIGHIQHDSGGSSAQLTTLNDYDNLTFEQIADVIEYVETKGLWKLP